MLGAGGVGTVFRARQIEFDRIVALKILHEDKAADQDFATRFVREAQALSKLHHVNIVSVYHLGVSASGRSYMAMECVTGKSIRTLLDEFVKLPVGQSVAILDRVAAALATAHEAGIVHRDLKPENIVLADLANPQDVKVIDFGLAHFNEQMHSPTNKDSNQRLTTTGSLIGTSFYMSPEQCLGQKIDHRSDIYSLTACFFEMVSGRRPFDADTAVGMLYQHINTPVPKIGLSNLDQYQPALNAFISKGMAKSPADRFQNMAEFSEALRSILNEQSSAKPSRIKLPIILTVALLCAGVAVASVAGYLGSQAKNAKKKAVFDPIGKKNATLLDHRKQSLSPLNQLIDLSRAYSQSIVSTDQKNVVAERERILQALESGESSFNRQKDTSFIAYILRSHVLHGLSRNAESIESATKALDASKASKGELTVESGEALKCLGNLYLWTGQLDKAESFAKQSIEVIQKSDNNPGSVPTIGTSEGHGGWPVKALRIDPWRTLGTVAEARKQYDLAEANFKKAEDLAKEMGVTMIVAESTLSRAHILKNNLHREKEARAIILESSNYVEEQLKEALLKQKQLPTAMMLMGDWCKNNGMNDLAIKIYQTTLNYERSAYAPELFDAIKLRLSSVTKK